MLVRMKIFFLGAEFLSLSLKTRQKHESKTSKIVGDLPIRRIVSWGGSLVQGPQRLGPCLICL